jgi:hypothetical protein
VGETVAAYSELVARHRELLELGDRLEPSWRQCDEQAGRDPDFAAKWQKSKVANSLENLFDASSYTNVPLFPQSVVVLSNCLEWRRQQPPVAEPTRYVWVGPRGQVDVDTDHLKWSHLPNWTRVDFQKAVSEGIVDADGKRIRKPEPEPEPVAAVDHGGLRRDDRPTVHRGSD